MFQDLEGCNDRFSLWAEILRRIQPTTVLEIGVWKGEFARHVLTAAPSIARYYMIDPWRALPRWNKPLNTSNEDLDAAYREALSSTAFAADRVRALRGTTAEVIDQINDAELDFVYIDGDHTLRGITIDLIRAYSKLKPGGYLGGDDFVPNIWQHGPGFEPTLVFPFAVYFAEAVGAPIEALPFHQFVIRKPLGPGEFGFGDPQGAYEAGELLGLMTSIPRGPSLAQRAWRKLRQQGGRLVGRNHSD